MDAKDSSSSKDENLSHCDVTSHKCDECGAKFKRKQILKRHKQALHSSIRFFCKECERSFSHRTNLIRHILVMHYNARRWLCGLCALGYCHSADLRRHLKVAHSLLLPAINNLLKKSRDEVYIFPELDTFTIDETVRLKLANICIEEEKKYESAVTSGSLDHVYPKIKEKINKTVDSDESFIHITCDNLDNQDESNETLNCSRNSALHQHEESEKVMNNAHDQNIIQLIQPIPQHTFQHSNPFYDNFPQNRVILCGSAVENNSTLNYQHKTIPSDLYNENRLGQSLSNVSIIPMISYQCSICHLTFLTNQNCLNHMESEHQATTRPENTSLNIVMEQCVNNILPNIFKNGCYDDNSHEKVAVQYPSDNISYTILCQPTKENVTSKSIEIASDSNRENIHSTECKDLQSNLNNKENNKTEILTDNGISNFSEDKAGNYEMELVVDEIGSVNSTKKNAQDLDFQCEICNSFFLTKKKLSRHKKIHSPAKHKCNSCQKTFFEKSNLNKHLKTHEDDTHPKYTCQQCDNTYRHAKDLKDHTRRVHVSEESASERIVCSHCSTHFTRKPHLLRHLRNVHNLYSNQPSDTKTIPEK